MNSKDFADKCATIAIDLRYTKGNMFNSEQITEILCALIRSGEFQEISVK